MTEVVITSAVRTAIGKLGGGLKDVGAIDLGALVIKEAVARANIAAGDIDEVVMGNVMQIVGAGGNPGRQAAVRAGLPIEVPAYAINKNCSSALMAITAAAYTIKAGEAEAMVAGGFESLSQAPHVSFKARWGTRIGNCDLQDMLLAGYYDPLGECSMGETAENLAVKYGISRQEQDEWSYMSQQRAEQAIKAGKFKEEIVPVVQTTRKGQQLVFDRDEHPTFGTTPERLAMLKPAFRQGGTVTAGNSSGINDGAAAVTLMNAKTAARLGVRPWARVVACASVGVDPKTMGIGPYPATMLALKKAGLKLGDIGLIECNEAFAAQIIAVERELKWDRAIVNVNGSGIALGHPVGCTGARIVVTLLHEMQRRDVKYGLATLCVGGGQGMAVIVENLLN